MDCPGCGQSASAERYPATSYQVDEVELDVCHHCDGIWFDGRESLQLTPGATFSLFHSIHERRAAAPQPLLLTKRCPRCEETLVETFDRVRGTPFTYFRCDPHGRFITFFQFLREKSLVRAPTPRELAELQARVKTVSCSNCGAPVELAATAVCSHCNAPISLLAPESLEATLKALHDRGAERTSADPSLALRLEKDRQHVEQHLRETQPDGESTDLVSEGVELFVRAFYGLFRG